jgi:hypothetical protein
MRKPLDWRHGNRRDRALVLELIPETPQPDDTEGEAAVAQANLRQPGTIDRRLSSTSKVAAST